MTSLRILGILLLLTLPAAPLPAADDEDTTPVLIKKAPEAVQKAWDDVQRNVAENEKLKKPLPDPYLARSEIWALVGSHEDALADQLKALELLHERDPSLLEQRRYLLRIQKTLTEMQKTPRPYYPADADKLYYLGRSFYFSCQFDKALRELNEAIRLNPREALYWYYRGLTYKAMRRTAEAERDVRVAGSLKRSRKQRKDVAAELERIQGPLRVWLTNVERERPEARP